MPTAIKVPYEFLVRWREGRISGAHVGWSLLVTEDDGTKREFPQPVEPVDIGQGKGFPLVDILDQLHIDALAEIERKDVAHADAIAAKDAEIAAALSEAAAVTAAKDAELAEKDAAIAAEKAARETKEKLATELATALAHKLAEVQFLQMPEEEKRQAAIRAEIERLQAELAPPVVEPDHEPTGEGEA